MANEPTDIPPSLSRITVNGDNPGADLSALERAAKRGVGPMGPDGGIAWHGLARPCVSCGELVRRSDFVCENCGQDLSAEMLEKMRSHSGPWYVHEHVRPFPGVSLERLIRQIRRGVLQPTTIVRGPTTFHQWRFAAETPVLAKYLGVCWNCQVGISPEWATCSECGADQNIGFEKPGLPTNGNGSEDPALKDLRLAMQSVSGSKGSSYMEEPKRFPTGILVAVILLITIISLIGVIKYRSDKTATPQGKKVSQNSELVLQTGTS